MAPSTMKIGTTKNKRNANILILLDQTFEESHE